MCVPRKVQVPSSKVRVVRLYGVMKVACAVCTIPGSLKKLYNLKLHFFMYTRGYR